MSIINSSSPASLKAEFEVARRLQQKGASWDQLEQCIVRLTGCSNNGGCAFETEMVAGIRSLSTLLNNAINSERSRLLTAATELISSLSAGLGPAFEPLISLFFPALLGLCARTNTVFARRAKACIFNVIENTRSPSLLSYLTESVSHKSTSLRLVAAKGVLACLNFKPLNDARAHLIEEVIKSTSQDARADVRKAGEKILHVYKALLPDGAESSIGLSAVTKKPSAVPCTAASRSTSPVLSRGRLMTGRVGPVVSLCAEKISSGTHSEQSHPLSSGKLQRAILAARPTISAYKDALHLASEAGQSSVQRKNSTTQRPQRVGNKGTVAPRATPQALSRGRPTIGRVSPAQGPSSMQNTHQRRDIARPSVPTSKLPQRVGTMHTRPRGEEPKSTPLRLVAAKGVLACLNFKPLNDTRAHLIEEVIKSTSQDARADVRKAGEKILQAYKTILPERAESFIAPSAVTEKSSVVQGTAASRSTSPVLCRGRPMTGRVGHVGSLGAEKISSGTHSERSHPLSSAKLQREILAARPTISARKDALHSASEAGQSSVQSTNSTTQRHQRGGNKGTVAPRETPQVLSRGRPMTGRVSPAQGASSMQSTHQRRDIIRRSVPTSKLPQRVGTVHTRPRGEEPKVTAPLPETDSTDLARTREE
ncbi:hypothetical protein AZE42_06151 [Rhizopogon vesiculosus]|uniref:CLASP N-terminal domain-containing protein n=1 Tax=Rhizopogon vesiculosus TaxID=180088 RepID=A0A1J8QWS1_9AGAM|nr:hypothetical protein AZE42_06151 [Rhizopogon vesiculosus]